KMTDFETGVWCDIWDGLYWRFVHEHKKVFKENPRSGFMVNMLKKMDEKKLKSHLKTADKFLDNLA
ncbi:MAG: cryptochrome/photolyase family protein, partial [Chlamydiia bacterium]|nr:cryptochrome/photolyase family protein [Chlamydiia bacterium]